MNIGVIQLIDFIIGILLSYYANFHIYSKYSKVLILIIAPIIITIAVSILIIFLNFLIYPEEGSRIIHAIGMGFNSSLGGFIIGAWLGRKNRVKLMGKNNN